MVLLHGLAGGWDELAVAVVALGVMYVAVKLAGRKAANDSDDNPESEAEAAPADARTEQADPVQPTPTKLG